MRHRALFPILLFTVVLLFTVALLLAAPAASACSCVAPGPPAESLADAGAVFCGEVVAFEEAVRDTGYGKLPQMRVEVALGSVWKGVPEGETVELWTGLGGGDCGYGFEVGEDYLVYAYEADDGSLSTGICSRTRPVERAGADFEALGEARREVPRGDG